MVNLTIQKRERLDIHPESIEKEIDGHKVFYHVGPVRDEGEFASIGINFDHLDYGYTMLYRLDDEHTEEDAIAFAKQIIHNNK